MLNTKFSLFVVVDVVSVNYVRLVIDLFWSEMLISHKINVRWTILNSFLINMIQLDGKLNSKWTNFNVVAKTFLENVKETLI